MRVTTIRVVIHAYVCYNHARLQPREINRLSIRSVLKINPQKIGHHESNYVTMLIALILYHNTLECRTFLT